MKNVLSLFLSIGLLASMLPQATYAQTVKFRRPLNTIKEPVYYSHYDHDTSSTGKKIYTCATTGTYENHRGTDFRADIGTAIYAAAKGGLYKRFDSCPTNGSWSDTCGDSFGNHVRIDHEGSQTDGAGWVTIYAHMKQGTVVGLQSLYCGTKVGETGNSGKSDAPHLHFEVRKYSYPNNDPFAGACSGSTSFWVNQNGGTPTTTCQ